MDETFAERLKRLREKRGLTVGVLALRSGLTEAAIRKMEYGDTKGHGLVNGLKIAEALDVDPWELAFGRRSKHSRSPAETKSIEARLRSLQDQVTLLIEIAKAGVEGLDLSEAQKRQVYARLEKLPEGDRTPS
jgi:transcriptional regulator with XRE-family HTH domain